MGTDKEENNTALEKSSVLADEESAEADLNTEAGSDTAAESFTRPEKSGHPGPEAAREFHAESPQEVMKRCGKQLKLVRLLHGKKQREVAAYLGLNREVYGRYERGSREVPVRVVLQLREYYGCTADELLGLAERTEIQKAEEKG